MNNLERVQPPVHPVGIPEIPQVHSLKLDNGIPAFLIGSGTEDILRMEFSFGAGQVKEPMPLMASTANMMLMEGSVKRSAEELHSILEYYGAFLHMISEKDRAGLVVFFLNRHLEKILELCHEILFQPAFPEPELNALMDKRLQWFRINREKVQNLAVDQFFESVFGPNHPYGHKPCEEDFSRLSTKLLKVFHSKYYIPANMGIIISGRIPEETSSLLNHYFGSMDNSRSIKDGCGEIIKGDLRKKILVEKTGTLQSAIRIGSRTINKRHPDYPSLKVVDAILGGYFGSRLMRNIREEKGYTYGIRSNVTSLGKY